MRTCGIVLTLLPATAAIAETTPSPSAYGIPLMKNVIIGGNADDWRSTGSLRGRDAVAV